MYTIIDFITSILVNISIFAIVTFGILCGAFAFFQLFGYICMTKQNRDEAWKSLWRERVK